MTEPTLDDLQDESTWMEWRSRIPAASHVTELVTTAETRREFIEGSRLLRLDKRRRAGDGGMGPSPVQLAIADMLNAGRKFNGVMEPRRTTKTTAIQAVILGRCSLREDYLVGWTMAKADGGQKTGERFRKDIVTHIDRLYPDKATRPFIVNTGKGTEHIRWPHGSYLNVYAPGNDAFTSGAYDIAWVDEAQDATIEVSDGMLTSIPPTLDGRYKPQMIGSGTAPDYRAGNLLWKLLHMEGAGVIRHNVPDDLDPDELLSWEPTDETPRGRVRELIELYHPGIGYTTPLSDVFDNFGAMNEKAFRTEYLGLAGDEGSNVALIPAPLWTAAALPLQDAAKPDVSTLCLFVHPDGDWASLVQAWKGKDHRTHVGLLHHQAGVKGLGKKVLVHARKIGRPIIFDSASAATANLMRELAEARPAPAQRPMVANDVKRAAVKFTTMIREDGIRHYGQLEMDAAAGIAVRRAFGTGNGWAFGRPDPRRRPGDDITPIEAAALAVYALDSERAYRSPLGDFAGV